MPRSPVIIKWQGLPAFVLFRTESSIKSSPPRPANIPGPTGEFGRNGLSFIGINFMKRCTLAQIENYGPIIKCKHTVR